MAGSTSTESHFNVRIIAACFDGLSLVHPHTHIHPYICINTTYIHAHTYTHTCTHHLRLFRRTLSGPSTHTHTPIHNYIHTDRHMYTRTYIHAHTYMHTYTYTHNTHTLNLSLTSHHKPNHDPVLPTLFYPALSFSPYPSYLPYSTLPCPALSFPPTLFYPALPYPTLSCSSRYNGTKWCTLYCPGR